MKKDKFSRLKVVVIVNGFFKSNILIISSFTNSVAVAVKAAIIGLGFNKEMNLHIFK